MSSVVVFPNTSFKRKLTRLVVVRGGNKRARFSPSLDCLPEEVCAYLAEFFDFASAVSMSGVSKRWNRIASPALDAVLLERLDAYGAGPAVLVAGLRKGFLPVVECPVWGCATLRERLLWQIWSLVPEASAHSGRIVVEGTANRFRLASYRTWLNVANPQHAHWPLMTRELGVLHSIQATDLQQGDRMICRYAVFSDIREAEPLSLGSVLHERLVPSPGLKSLLRTCQAPQTRVKEFTDDLVRLVHEFMRIEKQSTEDFDLVKETYSRLLLKYLDKRCQKTIFHPKGNQLYGSFNDPNFDVYLTITARRSKCWCLFQKKNTAAYGNVDGWEYIWRRVVDAFRLEKPLF
jgi:hypothetical protein